MVIRVLQNLHFLFGLFVFENLFLNVFLSIFFSLRW